MSLIFKFKWLFLILLIKTSLCEDPINYDQKLYDYLFETKGYDPYTFPQSGTTPNNPSLQIQLEVFGIMSVDLMESKITFKAAFRQWWNDTRVMWDPAEFGGVNMTYFKSDPNYDKRSWISDMYLRQDAGESAYLSDLKYTEVRVMYTGLCYFSQFGTITVIASFDLANYPYDEQTIHLTFGSWLYPDYKLHLDLNKEPFLVQDPSTWKISNIEWDFKDYYVTKILSPSSAGLYIRYDFVMVIQRNGGTILIAVMIPGIMITFLGCLYILLPRGDGQRIGYLSTILLTEIMFLVMIANFVPLSKIVPTLGWLFLAYTILLSILTLAVLAMEKVQQVFVEDHEDKQKRYLKKLRKAAYIIKSSVSTTVQEFSSASPSKSSARRSRYMDHSVIEQNDNSQIDMTNMDHEYIDGMMSSNKEDAKSAYNKHTIYQKELKKSRQKLKAIKRKINRIDFGVFLITVLAFSVMTGVILKQFFTA